MLIEPAAHYPTIPRNKNTPWPTPTLTLPLTKNPTYCWPLMRVRGLQVGKSRTCARAVNRSVLVTYLKKIAMHRGSSSSRERETNFRVLAVVLAKQR